jgi:hypothetical protein
MVCILGSPRRVFVSYSRSDFYLAEQLAGALRRRGIDVWFDVHELAPENDWSEAIDRAIEACDVFVLVASRAALESPYVQRERDLAPGRRPIGAHASGCHVRPASSSLHSRLPSRSCSRSCSWRSFSTG